MKSCEDSPDGTTEAGPALRAMRRTLWYSPYLSRGLCRKGTQ